MYILHRSLEMLILIMSVAVIVRSAMLRDAILRIRRVDRLDLAYINLYGVMIFATTFIQVLFSDPASYTDQTLAMVSYFADSMRHFLIPTALVLIFSRPSRLSKRFFAATTVAIILSIYVMPASGATFYDQPFPWMYIICSVFSLLCVVHVEVGLIHARSNGGINGPRLASSVRLSLAVITVYSILCALSEVYFPSMQVPLHVIAAVSMLPIYSYMEEGE